jgi:hypothetical protein
MFYQVDAMIRAVLTAFVQLFTKWPVAPTVAPTMATAGATTLSHRQDCLRYSSNYLPRGRGL